MAAPSFVTASTGTTDSTGAWTHTAAAPAAAGNFYVVHIFCDGTNGGISITSVTHAEDLAGTDNVLSLLSDDTYGNTGFYNVGNPAAALQRLYMGRALDTSAMVITGANTSGDDVYVRVYEFANVAAGTTLATVLENVTAGAVINEVGTSNTASDASVTTAGPDRLALNFVGVNDDNAISAFTGETGGDWTLAVAPYADSGGTDGAIGLQVARPTGTLVTTVFGDTGTSALYGGSGTYEQIAQSILTDAAASGAIITLRLTRFTSPADNITVAIQADTGGVPSGTDLASASMAAGSVVASPSFGNYPFNLTVSLSASTTYWIVLSRSGGRDTGNWIGWSQANGDYTDGQGGHRDSGSWITTSTDRSVSLLPYPAAGGTIDGGTGSIVDSDAWGVVGFALIGTTPDVVVYVPKQGFVNYQDPGVL